MAIKQVPIIDDPVKWAANHPGMPVPTGTVSEVDFAPTDSTFSGEKWTTCTLCGFVGRLSAMTKIGGKYYCQVNGCAEEVSE